MTQVSHVALTDAPKRRRLAPKRTGQFDDADEQPQYRPSSPTYSPTSPTYTPSMSPRPQSPLRPSITPPPRRQASPPPTPSKPRQYTPSLSPSRTPSYRPGSPSYVCESPSYQPGEASILPDVSVLGMFRPAGASGVIRPEPRYASSPNSAFSPYSNL